MIPRQTALRSRIQSAAGIVVTPRCIPGELDDVLGVTGPVIAQQLMIVKLTLRKKPIDANKAGPCL